VACEDYRELGEAAWAWVLGQIRDDEGPWLPQVVPGDEPPAGPGADRDSVYAGIGGMAPVLAEIRQHRALTGIKVTAIALAARLAPVTLAPFRQHVAQHAFDVAGIERIALRDAPGIEQAADDQVAVRRQVKNGIAVAAARAVSRLPRTRGLTALRRCEHCDSISSASATR